MRLIVKEGTKVKIKSREEIEQLLDSVHRINGLYFDHNMYNYCGQELEVARSWWNYTGDNYFMFEDNEWTWNLDLIEEVSEENMKDLDKVCADCGEEIENEDDLIYIDEYDKYVCRDCYEENYEECEDCGRIVHVDDIHSVEGGDRHVCDSCMDNYYYCEDCGECYYYESMHEDENGNWYCDTCWENNPGHRIYGYHCYPRSFEFFTASGEIKPPFYIGWELEMENDEMVGDCVDWLYDNIDMMLSRDGSLEGYGAMEMVSDPRSLKSHYEVADKLKEGFKMLVDNGYRSNDTSTCGLHFHVSRPYQKEIDDLRYSDNEEDKKKREELINKQEEIIDRIILVMETYKEELVKFSRRKDRTWCKWLSDVVSCDNGKITSLDFIKKVKGESMGHHRALNLENHNTIEFRIFKGTLNFNTFMASLELVNNIATLCSDLDLPLEKITWDKLTRGEYVSQYVDEKDIHTTRKVVDTSEADKIWNIIKNKKRARAINKVLREFDKYYQVYLAKFDSIKNSENWSLISDTAGKLREYTGVFKQVVDYKKAQDYDNLLYKVRDMFNYNMYFDYENEELQTIRNNIKELLNEVK